MELMASQLPTPDEASLTFGAGNFARGLKQDLTISYRNRIGADRNNSRETDCLASPDAIPASVERTLNDIAVDITFSERSLTMSTCVVGDIVGSIDVIYGERWETSDFDSFDSAGSDLRQIAKTYTVFGGSSHAACSYRPGRSVTRMIDRAFDRFKSRSGISTERPEVS